MAIRAPKGTKDLLPQDAYKWQYVEEKFKDIASTYGCREIRTPIFEHTELFERGVGDTTDVVQKEMYTFDDKGGRSITLKPEGTSPAVRAFIQNGLYSDTQPTKLFYFTPVFRYENVQKGRLRQHHQLGVEIFGSKDAGLDAEVISLAMRVYKELGISNLKLNINNIGCATCRKKYNEALKEYLRANYDNLCETCKTRFEKNPMRILDCKSKNCKDIVKEAPVILDYVCDECKDHFEKLQKYLKVLGMDYEVDPHIVRGLDYYSKTVFEIIDKDITVCGGGRYDYLIKEVGGPDMPAVGFGMGIERLLMTLEENGIEIPKPNYMDLYIGFMGENGKLEAVKLVNVLREKGIKCDCDHMDRSVKAQMRFANRVESSFTVVIGDSEVENRKARFKRMCDGEQFEMNFDDVDEILKIINE
ncbi:histidine--tRNA ligase [Haloimpatiens sp. FM7330]|uniref:histidine--tRNA ligase n=1 Tax=Haloimpatiens sp. FM7330 TaxID=3298610 RepID=UPI00363394FF